MRSPLQRFVTRDTEFESQCGMPYDLMKSSHQTFVFWERIMGKQNRTFTLIELGKSTAVQNIQLPLTEIVEVLDITTRARLKVKAKDVSMYRHTLHMQGKNFNIVNIWDSL
jgi:hypothetical protein